MPNRRFVSSRLRTHNAYQDKGIAIVRMANAMLTVRPQGFINFSPANTTKQGSTKKVSIMTAKTGFAADIPEGSYHPGGGAGLGNMPTTTKMRNSKPATSNR